MVVRQAKASTVLMLRLLMRMPIVVVVVVAAVMACDTHGRKSYSRAFNVCMVPNNLASLCLLPPTNV